MTKRAGRVLDFILYIAIALGVVFAAVGSFAYDEGRYKWGYLALGTALGLGLVLSAHNHQRTDPRFWVVVLTLFTIETILLVLVFRSRFFDSMVDDRGASRLLIYGIALGELFLNGWVLGALKPKAKRALRPSVAPRRKIR